MQNSVFDIHVYCILTLILVDCEEPVPPDNGTVFVTSGTTYGAEVNYECDTGFRLVGNASNVCNQSGQWEPEPPTCQDTSSNYIYNCFSLPAYIWHFVVVVVVFVVIVIDVVVVVVLEFIGINEVPACELTKSVCYQCDLGGPPGGCSTLKVVGSTQKDCYEGVDGVNKVLAQYRLDSSECHYRNCFYTAFKFRPLDREVTMMACSSGSVKYDAIHDEILSLFLN